MSDYDFSEDSFDEPEPEKKSVSIDRLDIFSILLLVGSLCLGAYFLLVFMNPFTALNPFPPNTAIPPVFIPTETITPLGLDEAWTPTPTIQPTITSTSRPTFTPLPTSTVYSLYTETPTAKPPTATATPKMPFEANSQLIDSNIIHPETSCDWLGIGGTVEDKNKSPMLGVVVRVQGELAETPVDIMTVSGVSQVYGKSGFEFVLGNLPLPSTDTLWVRLFDTAGLPLSDQIFISTSGDCTKNLTLIRFKQVR